MAAADRHPALERPPGRAHARGRPARPAGGGGRSEQLRGGGAAVSRRVLLLVAAWSLLAGCAVQSGSSFTEARGPSCRYQGPEGTALMVLIAQAVPSASQLPCVELKPAGW